MPTALPSGMFAAAHIPYLEIKKVYMVMVDSPDLRLDLKEASID